MQTVAEVHLIEIHLEDLLFRVQVLEVSGDDDFLELAAVSLAAVEEHQPRELLRDGASAFGAAARLQVLQERAADAHGIDAAVIEESLILDRDHGVDEVLRHLLQGDFDPLLLEDGERRPVARVEDRRRLDHVADVAQRLTIGKPRRQVVREPGDPAARGEHRDRQDRDRRHKGSGPPRERAPDKRLRALLDLEKRLLERNKTAMHGGLKERKSRAGSAGRG